MVDWRRIGRGRRKDWSESWSLHSYRGHEPEGKEIWKRLKQSLGCIAHSRTLPWLAYCFRCGPSGGGELDKLDGLDQTREALLGRFPPGINEKIAGMLLVKLGSYESSHP